MLSGASDEVQHRSIARTEIQKRRTCDGDGDVSIGTTAHILGWALGLLVRWILRLHCGDVGESVSGRVSG